LFVFESKLVVLMSSPFCFVVNDRYDSASSG
jgi:hypothetical protein